MALNYGIYNKKIVIFAQTENLKYFFLYTIYFIIQWNLTWITFVLGVMSCLIDDGQSLPQTDLICVIR